MCLICHVQYVLFLSDMYELTKVIFLLFCQNSRIDGRTDRILIAGSRLHSIQRGKNSRIKGAWLRSRDLLLHFYMGPLQNAKLRKKVAWLID